MRYSGVKMSWDGNTKTMEYCELCWYYVSVPGRRSTSTDPIVWWFEACERMMEPEDAIGDSYKVRQRKRVQADNLWRDTRARIQFEIQRGFLPSDAMGTNAIRYRTNFTQWAHLQLERLNAP